MDQGLQTNFSRQVSLCTAMQAIIHCGPISRASIAKQTGLSKQTISEVVRILCDEGWVQETGRTSGHVGRSATTYEIIPDSALLAVVDLGGTKMRAAIVDLTGQVLAEVVEPTSPAGGLAVAKQIGALTRRAALKKGIDFARVLRTVVGCPGVPDQVTGAVDFAPNILGIDAVDFRSAVSKSTQTTAILENDVNLAVLGEQWLGAGQGIDHLVFIALGSGIGAGIIANGALLRGATGAAGELGYLPFGSDPFEPESLRVGALERVVATNGIKAAYTVASGQVLDVPQIFDAAQSGDPAAQQVIEETARHMGRAVAAIAAVAAPELVILGGSIGVRTEIVEATRRELALCFPFPLRIEPSHLGNHAALSGAVAVGLTGLHTTLFGQSPPGAVITLPTPKGGLAQRAAE